MNRRERPTVLGGCGTQYANGRTVTVKSSADHGRVIEHLLSLPPSPLFKSGSAMLAYLLLC